MRFILALTFALSLFASDSSIDIEIMYGGQKEPIIVKTTYKNGDTALDALSKAAKVKTKKVNDFLFVTSVDDVASSPNKMGWFYSVDGKSTEKIASTNKLVNAKSMRWEFRADNCLSGADK